MKKLFAVFSVVVIAGCNAKGNNTNIELIQNMMDQISIKSQDWNPKEGEKVQMRQPPPGTVPRGFNPYKYATDPAAGWRQQNPLAGNTSAEVIELGRKNYGIYCAVCHGDKGDSVALVAEKMLVKPRILVSPDAKAYSDGRIYHAITAGVGLMGAYAGQIPDDKARWAVVNYVRTLQR